MLVKIKYRGSLSQTLNLRGLYHEIGVSADGLIVTDSPKISFFSIYQCSQGVTVRINDSSFKINGQKALTSRIAPGDCIENGVFLFSLYPVSVEVSSLALSGLPLEKLSFSKSKSSIKLEHGLSNMVQSSYLFSSRPLVIGSAKEADIVMNFPEIKKRHMRVWVEDGFPIAEPLEGSISIGDQELCQPTKITSTGSLRLNPGMMEVKFTLSQMEPGT